MPCFLAAAFHVIFHLVVTFSCVMVITWRALCLIILWGQPCNFEPPLSSHFLAKAHSPSFSALIGFITEPPWKEASPRAYSISQFLMLLAHHRLILLFWELSWILMFWFSIELFCWLMMDDRYHYSLWDSLMRRPLHAPPASLFASDAFLCFSLPSTKFLSTFSFEGRHCLPESGAGAELGGFGTWYDDFSFSFISSQLPEERYACTTMPIASTDKNFTDATLPSVEWLSESSSLFL